MKKSVGATPTGVVSPGVVSPTTNMKGGSTEEPELSLGVTKNRPRCRNGTPVCVHVSDIDDHDLDVGSDVLQSPGGSASGGLGSGRVPNQDHDRVVG